MSLNKRHIHQRRADIRQYEPQYNANNSTDKAEDGTLDKKLHSNWEIYDHYTGADGEHILTEDLREQSKNAVRMINLNKNRYAKKPTEELKGKILAWYGQVISPTDKLTNELKAIGILD